VGEGNDLTQGGTMFYLGVDVSKKTLDCMLLSSETGKMKSKSIANTSKGFEQLLEWLTKQKAVDVHVVMEPTGVYHEPAALALTDAGLVLSLVNPAQLRMFAQGIGVKTKTDKADSAVLARYGQTQRPGLWHPPSQSARRLKALLARRDAIADDLQREQNRREAIDFGQSPDEVKASIDQSIRFLQAELLRMETMIQTHIDDDPDLRKKSSCSRLFRAWANASRPT
jgi:transposase